LSIDDCATNFLDLATTVLPEYMRDIRVAMSNGHPLAGFCSPGVGVKSIVKKLGKLDDFSGCYVLLQDGGPFYVGISRRVVARLRQHGTGTSHFNATLAYRMARDKVPHKMTQSAAMKDPSFRRAFDEAKELLMGCGVAFIEIQNPVELYLFEAYCAMELDTCKWNTFRTH
jgi:hypothetical protein